MSIDPPNTVTNPGSVIPGLKVPGRKDDSAKLDVNLLFDDCPLALTAVIEVMQWAIKEKKPTPYDRGSWQGVHPDRYRAAQQRHALDAARQHKDWQAANPLLAGTPRHERDPETNLLHLAHKATSALFELELTLRELRR